VIQTSRISSPPILDTSAVSPWRMMTSQAVFRRVRYGEGRSETRMAWIKPVLVNGGSVAAGAVKTKGYVVH